MKIKLAARPGQKAVEVVCGAEDIFALKALYEGTALPHQQRQGIEFIIKNLAGIGMLSYHSGDAMATSFEEGQRCVGLKIAALLDLKTGTLTGTNTEND